VVYKVTEFWNRESEGGVAWDDPDLAIAWPLAGSPPQIVDRDAGLPRLAELGESPFKYEGGR